MTIAQLLEKYPFADTFFSQNQLDVSDYMHLSFKEYLGSLDEDTIEDKAIDIENLPIQLDMYIEQMKEFLSIDKAEGIQSLTIVAGIDKSKSKESFGQITIYPSQIISIVGPTGSGKSRLLADIEWTANCDTPTKRRILINGEPADLKWRYSSNNKLVSQLSQNMNFVMDLSAKEFISMHAHSRLIENHEEITAKILEEANRLAGEAFSPETPVTGLSGGQSRALMIADTALLSKSPIVLIDEIENAGIDRKKALELLVSNDKIVLMATHDPLLALMADTRIVIKNGGILDIINTSREEKELLLELEKIDDIMQNARQKLRRGESLKNQEFKYA